MLSLLDYYQMNLKINLYLLILFLFTSCTIDSTKNIIKPITDNKNQITIENNNVPKYIIGESYFIEGVKYDPQENYNYIENGLATFYGSDLHKKRTANNSFNNVTELLGRHKTLPLPSIVMITNLENGLSLMIKINDRHSDNSSIIQVSRKVAQLLRFYKTGIARVKIEILPDPSKQLKIVTESMNSDNFNNTLLKVPTEEVSITDLGETKLEDEEKISTYEDPIELKYENVAKNNLFVKIIDFDSYDEAQKLISSLEKVFKTTIENDNDKYVIKFGPLKNEEANKLFSTLIYKGYKNTEIIIE